MSRQSKLRRTNAMAAVVLLCVAVASCTGHPPGSHPVASASATLDASSLEVALQQATALARQNGEPLPEAATSLAFRGGGGGGVGGATVVWWNASGTFCTWGAAFAGSAFLSCSPGFPRGDQPALTWTPLGGWGDFGHVIRFAVADQERLLSLACGAVKVSFHPLGSRPLGRGLRTLYEIDTPWLPAGSLQAHVLRSDGTSATVVLRGADRETSNSLYHVCT